MENLSKFAETLSESVGIERMIEIICNLSEEEFISAFNYGE